MSWDQDAVFLFLVERTTESRESYALNLAMALYEGLKRLGYRVGQPIVGDALSGATMNALGQWLGADPEGKLVTELRNGQRSVAPDATCSWRSARSPQSRCPTPRLEPTVE